MARRKSEPAEPALDSGPRVYAIVGGRPFLENLAEALVSGNLPVPGGPRPDPLQLAGMTLYLPTRRATHALQGAFLRVSGGRALLLPRIKSIAEGSDELDLIASVADFAEGAAEPSRVISELERQLTLTLMVLRWAQSEAQPSRDGADIMPFAATGARTPAQAARLAQELARLIDELEIEGIDAARLTELVPDEFSEHWSATLEFLRIVTQFWPAHLAEHGLMSAVARRKRLMQAAAEQLRAAPPDAPVIVAGITGADPAALDLVRAVTALPNGALVLPTLDRTLDEESWASIGEHPEHPQFGVKKLLDALGLARGEVRQLARAESSPAQRARWSLACDAMRPAATTELWHRFAAAADKTEMAAALTGMPLIEAATAEEEAETIALMLREAAETPGRTASLITPDRSLARRVAARLATWDLVADDTAGQPFAATLAGTLLDLTATAVEKEFAPVALMSLLKHPLCRAGMPARELRRAIAALELGAFRSPYFGKGLDGVEAALESAQARSWSHLAVRRLDSADWQAARELLRRLRGIFAPLLEAFARSSPASVQDAARLHFATAQALAATPEDNEGSALRRGEAGEWATQFFASLIDRGMPPLAFAAADYPAFYRTMIAAKRIRAQGATHPRIAIRDPRDARLQHADLVILGGLNEGTWPQAADPGPWLNRAMRATLGLAAPEERLGAAAHDFVSQLGAERVVLTRAAKVDGAPTVASRWVLRLQALVAGMGLSLEAEQPWLAWARARNGTGAPRPVRAPEPRPPVELRPRQLSVTTIETWIANPYAVFARRILRLEPLPLLGERAGPSLRGQIVHDALGRFAQRYPTKLPRDIAGELRTIAGEILAGYTGNPRVAAFWVQRLARFAQWFAETEPGRRAGIAGTLAEVNGKMVLQGPAGPFILTARADRIDVGPGGLIITDYKSSQSLDRLASRAASAEAPQLPLEAAIAAAKGFANAPAQAVLELRYISTSGGEPPGQEVPLEVDDIAALTRAAQDGLTRLIAEFDQPDTPYRAVRRARFTYDYDEYAHLARVGEWQVDSADEDPT